MHDGRSRKMKQPCCGPGDVSLGNACHMPTASYADGRAVLVGVGAVSLIGVIGVGVHEDGSHWEDVGTEAVENFVVVAVVITPVEQAGCAGDPGNAAAVLPSKPCPSTTIPSSVDGK